MEEIIYVQPQRRVYVPADIANWEKSTTYQDILGFLTAMNESIKGKKLSCDCNQSKVIINLSKLFDKISIWVDEIPPVDQPQRYGNKAFREFYIKVKENCVKEMKACLPEEYHPALFEISPYLIESFGNSTRIDYGTGHELSFIMFLCSLHKIGALMQEDSIATVTILFKRYLNLCRKLQTTYKMEPAGSQGVWSLDDFQFIPFLWGSSQLMMHPKISPEMLTHEKVVHEYANEYLFLSCIQYILLVKNGPFAEHSNQLWNISGVQSWSKINQGLLKMYKAEVLSKYPIIQHVLFGSIFALTPAQTIRFHPPSHTGSYKCGVGMVARMGASGMAPCAGTTLSEGPKLPTPLLPVTPEMGTIPPKFVSKDFKTETKQSKTT